MSGDVEIAPLDLGDRTAADELVAVQRASFRVEADYLGTDDLPALRAAERARPARAPPPAARPPARRRRPRAAPRPRRRGRRRLRDWHLVLGCLALAALAHRVPAAPTYDPWAWIIWGREIVELDLDTRTGPSWKPLPVLFTTPFALAGDDWAPELWLVVAQAGGLLAFAFTYRLAARLAGPRGGRASPLLGLLLADEFVRHFARGNSEGLLVALLPVGGRAPPRRPPHAGLPARRRRRAAAAGAVAVPARLRAVADVARAAPALRSCSAAAR